MGERNVEKLNREELEREMLFDPMNRWYVGRLNLLNVVRPHGMPDKVIIKDETLREGEETPGVYLTLEKKLRIARALEEIGIREIEVGYAGSTKEHFEFTRALKDEGINLWLCSHARAYSKEDEWKRETEEVAKSGADMISFVGYVSECRIAGKSWLNKREFPKRIHEVITFAKDHGLRVGFRCGRGWGRSLLRVRWSGLRDARGHPLFNPSVPGYDPRPGGRTLPRRLRPGYSQHPRGSEGRGRGGRLRRQRPGR
jgi:hypothetical protein